MSTSSHVEASISDLSATNSTRSRAYSNENEETEILSDSELVIQEPEQEQESNIPSKIALIFNIFILYTYIQIWNSDILNFIKSTFTI